MDELIRKIIEALEAARVEWEERETVDNGPGRFGHYLFTYRREPCSIAQHLSTKHLTPILRAALAEHAAQHVADNAIVTRETLRLLAKVREQRKDGGLSIQVFDNAAGHVRDLNGEILGSFHPSSATATPDDALASLLEPEEAEECECCQASPDEPEPDGLKEFSVGIKAAVDRLCDYCERHGITDPE